MIIDAATLKNPIKPKADSTLNNMRKADLIEYIRCLEHNYNAAVWFNENQARYIEQLGLKGAPIVKAELAQHGRWRKSDFIPGMLTCSVCGAQRNPKFKIGGGGWHFCPNCGNPMDKEAEHETGTN